MQNKEITLEEWLLQKPYNEEVASDACYIKLANQLKKVLVESEYFTEDHPMHEEDATVFACMLAAYVEDMVSETQIFETFKRQHKALYGQAIPFVSDYYGEEYDINYDDVKFLLWYYLSLKQPDTLVYMNSMFFAFLLDDLFGVIEERDFDLEENEDLKQYYTLPHEAHHIFQVRDLIDNLLFKTYLFYPDSWRIFTSIEETILADNYPGMSTQLAEQNRDANLFENRFNFIWEYRTRLLAFNGKEWAANMLGKAHPLYQDILNISRSIRANFIYKAETEDDFIIEHIASGKQFELSKQSITMKEELIANESILYLSINQWQGKWWSNGIISYKDFDADLILDEKASKEEKQNVAFLDTVQERKVKEHAKKEMKHFLDFNNNSPIAFMPTCELSQFINDFSRYYRKCENIQAPEGASGEITIDNITDEWDKAFVFYTLEDGLEISYSFVDLFPDENNPYYNAEAMKDKYWNLILSKHASKELTHYFFDNYKEQLPDVSPEFDQALSKNIDFAIRFWKNDSCFS